MAWEIKLSYQKSVCESVHKCVCVCIGVCVRTWASEATAEVGQWSQQLICLHASSWEYEGSRANE